MNLEALQWTDETYHGGRKAAHAKGPEGSWQISPTGDRSYQINFKRAMPEGETYQSIMDKMKVIEEAEDQTPGRKKMGDDWRALYSYISAQDVGFTDSITVAKLAIEAIRKGNHDLRSAQEILDEHFEFERESRYSTGHDPRFPPNGLVRNLRSYKYKTQKGELTITLEEADIKVLWQPGGRYFYYVLSLAAFRIHHDYAGRTLSFFPEGVTDVRAIGAQFIVDSLIPFVEGQDMRKRYYRGVKKVED